MRRDNGDAGDVRAGFPHRALVPELIPSALANRGFAISGTGAFWHCGHVGRLQALGVRLSGLLRPPFKLGGEARHGHLKQGYLKRCVV